MGHNNREIRGAFVVLTETITEDRIFACGVMGKLIRKAANSQCCLAAAGKTLAPVGIMAGQLKIVFMLCLQIARNPCLDVHHMGIDNQVICAGFIMRKNTINEIQLGEDIGVENDEN